MLLPFLGCSQADTLPSLNALIKLTSTFLHTRGEEGVVDYYRLPAAVKKRHRFVPSYLAKRIALK
jgi:hypothetical protein